MTKSTDVYLRRAVRGAISMLEDTPDLDNILAFHFAVGLFILPEDSQGATVPQIIKDGLWALHDMAHVMADGGEIRLDEYANEQIVAALRACDSGIKLVAGGAVS